jgi:hypothetical protein
MSQENMRWLGLGVLVLVGLVAVGQVLGDRDESTPSTTPRPIESPLVFTGDLTRNTEAFELVGGDYRSRWSVEAEPGGCAWYARLEAADNESFSAEMGGFDSGAGSGTISDETFVYAVPPGRYYIAVGTSCDGQPWSVELSPA